MFRKTLVMITVAVAVGLVGVMGLGLANAQAPAPSATRTISPTMVAPGGQVEVTLAAANYGAFGSIVETLPAGFEYVSSTDPDVVEVTGQTVDIILFEVDSFTYTVTAPDTAGTYTISGVLSAGDTPVGGDSTVTVEAAAPEPGGASATRSISPTTVAASGQVEVILTAADYGGFGGITETLPAGFEYVSSTDEDAVEVTEQTVEIVLFEVDSFTYTVTAPDTAGTYTINGVLTTSDGTEVDVGGASSVTVRAAAPEPGGPSATRSFSPTTVAPDGQVVVTINASNYGSFGGITETLPSGFEYVASTLDEADVEVTGQTVEIVLFEVERFTYTVTAPGTEGTYTFNGVLTTSDGTESSVGGAARVMVRTPVTPPPSSTNTAPRFRTGTAFSVAENTTAVATVLATDSDSQDSVTGYNITGGADQDEFSLVSNTGDLSFTTAPDFDAPTDADTNNEYVLMVTAYSGAGDRQRTATQTIAVTVTGEGAPVEPGADTCIADLGALTASQTVMGAWASDCPSTAKGGSYARYYTFTLDSPTQVEMNLTSGVDAYLALRQGAGRDGTMVASNDNVGSRNPNSAINMMLAAGDYTVEATTFFAGQTGDFTLSVRPLQETEDLGTLAGSVDRSNSMWVSDYMSTQQAGSYARSYTFTVDTATHVAINLTSPEDSYLYVLDSNGAVVHESDNVTDRNLNSRIDETLAAGMYTIEATTYHPARMGAFHLSIGVLP